MKKKAEIRVENLEETMAVEGAEEVRGGIIAILIGLNRPSTVDRNNIVAPNMATESPRIVGPNMFQSSRRF